MINWGRRCPLKGEAGAGGPGMREELKKKRKKAASDKK